MARCIWLGRAGAGAADQPRRLSEEEGDHAILTRAGAAIFDASGAPATREVQTISTRISASKRGLQAFHGQGDARAAQRAHRTRCPIISCPAGRGDAARTVDFAGCSRLVTSSPAAPRICPACREILVRAGGGPAGRDRHRIEFRYREPPLGRGRSASSSASPARRPTRWRPCALSVPGRADPRRSSTRDLLDRARRATWRCRSCRPRDRRRLDQGLHLSARGARRSRDRAGRQLGRLSADGEAACLGARHRGARARPALLANQPDRRRRSRRSGNAGRACSGARRHVPIRTSGEGALKLKGKAISTPKVTRLAS